MSVFPGLQIKGCSQYPHLHGMALYDKRLGCISLHIKETFSIQIHMSLATFKITGILQNRVFIQPYFGSIRKHQLLYGFIGRNSDQRFGTTATRLIEPVAHTSYKKSTDCNSCILHPPVKQCTLQLTLPLLSEPLRQCFSAFARSASSEAASDFPKWYSSSNVNNS